MLDIGRKTRAEFALVVVTALAVVFLPIQTGVGLAIVLSLVHGMWTTTRTRLIVFERLPGTSIWWPKSDAMSGETLEGVLVAAFQAPLSFLNAYQFQDDFLKAHGSRRRRIETRGAGGEQHRRNRLHRRAVFAEVIARATKCKVDFAIARLELVRAQEGLERFGILAQLGENRLFHSVDEATRALAPDAKPRRR